MTSTLRVALARRLALIAAVGAACALLSGAVGAAVIRARLGGSAVDSFAAVETEVRRRLDSSAEALAQISARVAASRELIRAAPHDAAAARIDRASRRG